MVAVDHVSIQVLELVNKKPLPNLAVKFLARIYHTELAKLANGEYVRLEMFDNPNDDTWVITSKGKEALKQARITSDV